MTTTLADGCNPLRPVEGTETATSGRLPEYKYVATHFDP